MEEGVDSIWHDGVAYLGEELLWRTEKMLKRLETKTIGRNAPPAEEGEILTIGINHGVGCRGGKYAYEIRPNVKREQFLSLERAGRIISNTTRLQAVEFNDGSIGAVFHEAGSLGDFETDTPCVFILERDKIYLAEPTHLAEKMKIGFRGRSYSLDLPQGGQAGAAVIIPINGK